MYMYICTYIYTHTLIIITPTHFIDIHTFSEVVWLWFGLENHFRLSVQFRDILCKELLTGLSWDLNEDLIP